MLLVFVLFSLLLFFGFFRRGGRVSEKNRSIFIFSYILHKRNSQQCVFIKPRLMNTHTIYIQYTYNFLYILHILFRRSVKFAYYLAYYTFLVIKKM